MALPRWIPDALTRQAGIAARVSYTNAPKAGDVPAAFRLPNTVQIPIDNRLRTVRDAAKDRVGWITETYAGGRSVPRADNERIDMHQAGRAVDLMIPPDKRSTGGPGDALANWLVQNAERFGLQFIAWKGTNWSAGRSGDGRFYARNSDDHDNHLHVEVQGPQGGMDGPRRHRSTPGEVSPVVAIVLASVALLGALALAFYATH